MPPHHANAAPPRLDTSCLRAWPLVFVALALFSPHVQATNSHRGRTNSMEPNPAIFSIKVYDDRMTVAMAGAAQVYLAGVIDADAPERFAALTKSWKIPPGSDVYLNASGDNVDAGIALGRLFRAGAMSTHLGRPTRGAHLKPADKTSICTGACAYAYLGGVYRWAPTGNDRFGITAAPLETSNNTAAVQPSTRITAYLNDMGIAPAALAGAEAGARNGIAWPTADQMFISQLANNGRQPLIASYRLLNKVPNLELDQLLRRGEQRITLQCKPGSVLLTAYDKVGLDRARQVVGHTTRSYLEIDTTQTLTQRFGGATLDGDAVVVTRRLPPDQLGKLLSAKSVGAWLDQPNGRLRYGFAFRMDGISRVLKTFYDGCWKYAPWPVKSGA